MEHERIPLPLAEETCRSCGRRLEEGHDEDCLLAEHEAFAAGDEIAAEVHDPDDCYWCLAPQPPVASQCRCAECCRRLVIEVDAEDARRELKIAERCSPIYLPAELTANGQRQLMGFLLNSKDNGHACAFLDRATNLCTIYETRPLVCRLFNCDGEGRGQLTALSSPSGDDGA